MLEWVKAIFMGKPAPITTEQPIGFLSTFWGKVYPFASLVYAGNWADEHAWKVCELASYPLYGELVSFPAWDSGIMLYEDQIELAY